MYKNNNQQRGMSLCPSVSFTFVKSGSRLVAGECSARTAAPLLTYRNQRKRVKKEKI